MKYYFLIMGILCLTYYMVLAFYSRRLKSTFAAFWLINGGMHLLLGCMPLSVYMYAVLGFFVLACWILFLAVEYRIVSAMKYRSETEPDWIIVLGAQVRGTRVTESLRRRLDKALEYAEKFPQMKLIVSGGQGPGEEISEADAMAQYLAEKGVDRERICCEDRSASTRENLRYSRKYLDADHDRIGIVTNDFHIYRASVIARQEGYKSLIPIPASSNPVFQLNYLVREFFGVIDTWMQKGK